MTRGNELDKLVEYLYTEKAIRMQDLDKDIYISIYDMYDDFKEYITINSVGMGVIYSLSRKGRRYAIEQLQLEGKINGSNKE